MLKEFRDSMLGRLSDEDIEYIESMSKKELEIEIGYAKKFLQHTVSRFDAQWLLALEEELADRNAGLDSLFHRKGYTDGKKN